MTFVNRIASIVHTNVVKFGGTPNKNIGDAFLFAWKLTSFNEEPTFAHKLNDYLEGIGNEINSDERDAITMLSDLSVYSIIKIIAKTNSYKQILAYREHKGLNERIKDYAVKIGYGLHMGWAIEGLIGSPYKVDASYLSPHVNLSACLEAGTKQYGVTILISDKIHDFMSLAFKAVCRQVDVCTIAGSSIPIKLYTIDTQVENLPKSKDRFLKMNVK